MSDHVTPEELEALALGELPPELAVQVEEHAGRCASCGRDLAWLRAERALVERRAAAAPELPPEIWREVERRAYAPVSFHARRSTWVGAAIAVSAAAALAVIIRPVQRPAIVAASPGAVGDQTAKGPPPAAARALDRAEGDYRSALTVLEAEYARSRDKLDARTQERWDRTVSRARVQLASASAAAGGDVNARLRVLDGYAAMVRSLGRAIEESEEATP
jgi:hypothetical protein